MALEVLEANLEALNYHNAVLEEATPEDREQRQNHSQTSQWWKEVNKRGTARLPKRSTEAKNLDDDEQKIYENLTQLNKVTEERSQQQAEEHSQQQARRAQPTAGEKSTANSRREEHSQASSR